MLYLEDFAVGQKFGSGRLKVDEQRINSFGAEFDPQPFHLDDAAARSTIFRGLAAKRLAYGGDDHAPARRKRAQARGRHRGRRLRRIPLAAAGAAGDELRLEIEVMEVRPSKSRPDRGLIKVKTTTVNQNGEPVQVSVGNLVVLRRPTKFDFSCNRAPAR